MKGQSNHGSYCRDPDWREQEDVAANKPCTFAPTHSVTTTK